MSARLRRFLELAVLLVLVVGGAPEGKGQERFNLSHGAVSASQAILFVTRDAGVFGRHGLDPKIIFVMGGPLNIAALLGGSVDFAIVAGPAAISANLAGAETALLMSFVNSLEYAVFSDPAIKKAEDLRGKRIGVSRPGASDHYSATVALRRWGLEPDKDVSLVLIGSPSDRFTALKAGRVDAALFQPPLTTKAKKDGFRELADLSDLGMDYLGTSLVTTRSVIAKKEALVRGVVRAFIDGIHFYKTNKEASLKTIAKLMKIDDQEALEDAYNRYAVKYMARAPYPSVKGIQVILTDLAKSHPNAKSAYPASFVEIHFLRELEESGYIARLYGENG